VATPTSSWPKTTSRSCSAKPAQAKRRPRCRRNRPPRKNRLKTHFLAKASRFKTTSSTSCFAGAPASSENATLDLIRDVELDLRIELGRTNLYLEDVLKLRKGSVVPLDKLAGDPVDIFVNGRLIARGEVLVLNDNFCVRVTELVAGAAPAA